MERYNLKKYGLTADFAKEAVKYDGLSLARVTEQHRELYKVIGESGEKIAVVSGKLMYQAALVTDFPAVGDWVLIGEGETDTEKAVIHQVLPRKSVFTRKAAGSGHEAQIVAANIDVVFICMSLNDDFNLRRLERYLAVAWDSGARPVIVLTKADLSDDISEKVAETETAAIGVDIIVCSGVNGYGVEEVRKYLQEGETIAFIGSSGVGKSTLINRLLGEDRLRIREIRVDDDKGRHTTTYRQLLLLPEGGIVIDTPGMRELQLDAADLSRSFADIEALAGQCKFRDCSHTVEPGCAVQRAIERGELSQKRFESYKKLQAELGYEGLNARQLEEEKIKRMFGSKGEMKQMMRQAKQKNK